MRGTHKYIMCELCFWARCVWHMPANMQDLSCPDWGTFPEVRCALIVPSAFETFFFVKSIVASPCDLQSYDRWWRTHRLIKFSPLPSQGIVIAQNLSRASWGNCHGARDSCQGTGSLLGYSYSEGCKYVSRGSIIFFFFFVSENADSFRRGALGPRPMLGSFPDRLSRML